MALQAVVTLLQASRSLSDAVRKPAEQQIMQYFEKPGFGMFLCNIIATRDGSLTEAVRLLASTHLMSLCSARWILPKKATPEMRVIPDDEKAELRSAVVQLLSDPSVSVANIMTTTIARMVKHDFPDVWPNIFAELCTAIASQPPISVQNRLLQTLRACCRTIANLIHTSEYDSFDNEGNITQLYDRKRNTLKQLSSSIFAAVAPLWTQAGTRFLQYIQQGDSSTAAIDTGNQCLHAAKVLYTLMVSFMSDFAQENIQAVINFFQEVHGALGTFLNVRTASANPNHPLMPLVEKIFIRLVKLVAGAQEENPYAFIPILKPFLDFFYPIVSQPPAGALEGFTEKVIVKGIRFYANVVSSREYVDDIEEHLKYERRAQSRFQPTSEMLQSAHAIMEAHFTPEVIQLLSRVAITRYMMLTESDLEQWDEDPEEFLTDELADAFNYTIIAAGEYLFLRMLYYKGKMVAPEVSAIVQNAVAQCNVPNPPLEHILLKDAAYCAVSLGESALSDTIDFSQMFNGQLAVDARNPDPRYRLIRRRIASIISFWIYDIPAELTTAVYELCISFMAEQDKIVRIHGAIAIRHLLESSEIDHGAFSPFVQRTIEEIVRLVHDMKESNLSGNVLEILAAIIEHFGRQIAPFAQILLTYMFRLWEECGTKRALTKQTILRVLTKLIEAIPSSEATNLQIMFAPLIEYCVRSQSALYQVSAEPRRKKDKITVFSDDEGSDAEYLLEDGIALWSNLIQQCENLTMDIAKLFEYVPNIARTFQGTVNQMGCLLLLQSYICIGGPEFLSSYIGTVADVLDLVLSTSKPMTASKVMDAISVFIQLYPRQAPQHLPVVLKRVVAHALEKSGNVLLETSAGSLLSRLVLLNKEFFIELMSVHVVGLAEPAISLLLNFWIESARALDYIQDMKAWTCAMASLLVTNENLILANSPRIVNACISVLKNLRAKESDPSKRRDFTSTRDMRIVGGSHFERVFKQLDKRDVGYLPYYEVQTFFIQRLRECIQLNGSQLEANLLGAVTPQSREWLQNPPGPIQASATRSITIIDDDDE